MGGRGRENFATFLRWLYRWLIHGLSTAYPHPHDSIFCAYRQVHANRSVARNSQEHRKKCRNACSLLENERFLVCFARFASFGRLPGGWGAASPQKVRTKRFYTPPLGGKKRQAYLCPPKKIFWQAKNEAKSSGRPCEVLVA